MTISTDPNLDRQYLVEATRYDPASGSTVTEYLATRDVTFGPSDTAPSLEYDGRVTAALQVRRDMYSGDTIGGRSLPSYGAIAIACDSLLLDGGTVAAWRRSGWDGRRIRVLQGLAGSAYSAHEVLFDGVGAGGVEFTLTEIRLPIADIQARLDQPIQPATYAGTGGFEGGADLKGKTKPDAFGQVCGVTPVAVDPADLWWDLAPTTGLHSVGGVWDGGVALTATASNPPASGQYYVDLANGRIRTGATPTYGLTVDCRGAFGANSTTVAGIVSALATGRLGFSSGELDAAAFAALNGATVGYYADDRVSGLDVLDALIGSIGGYYTATRAGLLTVGRLEVPTATSAGHAAVALLIDDTDLERGGLEIRPVAVPPWRLELGYRRNWTTATTDQIDKVNAIAAQRSFMLEAYRVEAAENAATKTTHTLSQPLRSDTLLDLQSDAATEVVRRKTLYSASRLMVTARLQTQPFALELNDEVWISSELYSLEQPFRVIGIDENARDSRVTLTLWG